MPNFKRDPGLASTITGPNRKMLRATFTLKLGDGRSVSARIAAPSPQDRAPVEYRGDVELLTPRFEKCRLSTLRVVFQTRHAQLGGDLREKLRGQYDSWAL